MKFKKNLLEMLQGKVAVHCPKKEEVANLLNEL